jgi:DNA-binding NarL/FixJ family response regulator
MPGPSAEENVQLLLKHFPKLKILAMFEKEDQENLYPLLALGVDGYLYKDEAPDVLIRAIRSMVQGDPWMSRRALAFLIKRGSSPPRKRETGKAKETPLSSRELEIIHLLAKGLSNDQIAVRLSIAERTVRHHVEKILVKLDAPNRTRAAMIAIQQGWIEP